MTNSVFEAKYRDARENGSFYEQKRGLIRVWGREAVQFLNGLLTNDVAKLEDGAEMLAAFPNAQGRLLAVVRVLRHGDRFLFETEESTRDKVFGNLFRFTFAGDFFAENVSENFRFFSVHNGNQVQSAKCKVQSSEAVVFETKLGADYFVPLEAADDFLSELKSCNSVEIDDELYETLRIENGLPLYGVDMDETTIVPELGIDGLISYNKGCYIGQEIIARIYFRGHVAKQLRGLILSETAQPGDELKSAEGKNAGRITSVIFSPALEKHIALANVRYDYLAEETELKLDNTTAIVKNLPFVN